MTPFRIICAKLITNHPWLSRIPAPVGSQEVLEHIHKLAMLIGQHFLVQVGSPLHMDIPVKISKNILILYRLTRINRHILWDGNSLDNRITSCDPTGTGILDNPGCNGDGDFSESKTKFNPQKTGLLFHLLIDFTSNFLSALHVSFCYITHAQLVKYTFDWIKSPENGFCGTSVNICSLLCRKTVYIDTTG